MKITKKKEKCLPFEYQKKGAKEKRFKEEDDEGQNCRNEIKWNEKKMRFTLWRVRLVSAQSASNKQEIRCTKWKPRRRFRSDLWAARRKKRAKAAKMARIWLSNVDFRINISPLRLSGFWLSAKWIGSEMLQIFRIAHSSDPLFSLLSNTKARG